MTSTKPYATKLLVPYIRVSTDDKGQDPERQLVTIAPWAEREGYTLLEPAVDNGTSASKVPALKRPIFLEACERAKAARASIIMEGPDRFSRQDPDVAVWEKVEVERRYEGVQLVFACMSWEMQRSPLGKVFLFFHQATGHIWVEEHRKKVLSGNVRARARGQRLGRAPKEVTFTEEQQILTWRKKHGWEKIAQLLSAERGAHLLTDAMERRRRSISASALKRWWAARESVHNEKPEIQPVETPAGERGALTG